VLEVEERLAQAVLVGGGVPVDDILGPLEPAAWPGTSFPWGRLAVPVLAVALVAAACAALLWRRGPRVPGAAQDAREDPLEGLDGLDAGRFYERVLAAVRERIEVDGRRSGRSLTARELAALPLRLDPEAAAQWAGVCVHAEQAEFAGADFGDALRSQDLDLVRTLLAAGTFDRVGERP
jgi:hypothetical protein